MKKILYYFTFLFCFTPLLAAEDFPIKEALAPYVENGELPGIVTIIADRERVLQMDVIGMSNRETETPMGGQSVFWIASQSKPITAVAVMMLVEEGKLSLDEPVTTYLPELAELRVLAEKSDERTVLVPLKTPVTLRQLLSHTSGMPFVPPIQGRYGIDILSLKHTVVACAMTPLQTQPGEAYAYSNLGIEMAAACVERVSGMPFEEFLQRRLFDPLEMKDTTFWPTVSQQERMALVYRWDGETKQLVPLNTPQLTYPLENREIRHPAGAGGLFSTPRDLVKFYQMLLNEGKYRHWGWNVGRFINPPYYDVQILSPESVREIAKKQTGDLPNGYGLGVVTHGPHGEVFGHGGMCGTDSMVDRGRDRVYLYFVQELGCPKAGEAREAFFRVARP